MVYELIVSIYKDKKHKTSNISSIMFRQNDIFQKDERTNKVMCSEG